MELSERVQLWHYAIAKLSKGQMKTLSILVIFGALALSSAQWNGFHHPHPHYGAPAPAPAPAAPVPAPVTPASPNFHHPSWHLMYDHFSQFMTRMENRLSQMDTTFHNWMNSMVAPTAAPPAAPLG